MRVDDWGLMPLTLGCKRFRVKGGSLGLEFSSSGPCRSHEGVLKLSRNAQVCVSSGDHENDQMIIKVDGARTKMSQLLPWSHCFRGQQM